MAGRKKFGTTGLINNMKKRSKIVDDQGFTLVPCESLRSLANKHLASRFLIVNGTPIKFNFSYTREAVLGLFSNSFPCEKDKTGNKLASIPVFYSLEFKEFNGSMKKTYQHTAREMLEKYNQCEIMHKVVEGRHHPDSPKFETNLESTFECVFDVYSSLLRESSIRTSFQRLIHILGTDKFSKLDPLGLYAAIMHLMIRGVANAELFRISGQWRKKPEDQLEKLAKDFENGIVVPLEIASYRRELHLHATAVRQEIRRARFKDYKHDHSKYWEPMVWYYTWHWGVFKQMTPVQQHRYISGCDVVFGFPTMFLNPTGAISAGVEQGIDRSSPIIKESIDYAAEKISATLSASMRNVAKDVVQEASIKTDSILESKIDQLGGELKNVIESFFDRAEGYREDSLNQITEKFDPYLQSIVNTGDDITHVFSLLTNQLDFVIKSVMEWFGNPLGLKDQKIDAASLLNAFKYLVFFLNVENTTLKALCIVQILSSLGILQQAMKFMKPLFTNLFSYDQVETDESAVPGEPTFDVDSWASILQTPLKLVRYIVVLFASMAGGAALSVSKIGSLLTFVSKPMREFHFIGGGILGIQRICTAAKDLYKSVSEWIMKNVFGRTPERELIAQRVAAWILQVRYFSTEVGINAIRSNKKILLQAEKLFATGQALLVELAEPSPNADKFLLSQMQRYWRNSQQLASLIHRIRSASTFNPTMFHVQFVGQAGIGKSTLTKAFVHDILKNVWSEDEINSFWAYNPNLEYFDGYSGQKIMMVDDMFRFNDPKHLTSLIGLVTNVPVILPMANLEDKGLQMTSEFLVSSTNTAYPIGKDIYCMEAVYRRRHMLVHVTIDQRVLDKSTSQFSSTLFEQYYPGQDSSKFPHLKFSLIKPVPMSVDRLEVLSDSQEERIKLISVADWLKGNNTAIVAGQERIDPDLYFSSTSRPPTPLNLPCEDWSYQQFLTNTILRYHNFRGMEAGYTNRQKFAHVQSSLAEVDQIISQHTDIPEGVELPRVRLIEDLISPIMSEYDCDDPVTEHTFNQQDTSPELSDISLESLSYEIITSQEGEPTMDRITLEEEMERARRIKSRRGFTREPIALQNKLRVKVDSRGEYVSINPGFTTWQRWASDYTGDSRSERMNDTVRLECNSLRDVVMTIAQNWVANQHPSASKIEMSRHVHQVLKKYFNWITEFNLAALTIIPNSEEFSCDMRGQTTGLNLFFLQRMYEENGEWRMSVKDMNFDLGFMRMVAGDGEIYPVSSDIALLLAAFEHFRVFTMQFDAFTVAQQRKLVEDAKWRYKYLGYYTIQKIREDLKGTWKQLPVALLDYVSRPFVWLGSHIMKNLPFVLPILILASLWALLYSLSKLFVSANPTSKYLHRGPPSGVVYRGKTTAEYNNLNGPMSMVSSFLKRNSREIEISCNNGTRRCQAIASKSFLILNKHCVQDIKNEIITLIMYHPSMEKPCEVLIPSEHIICDPDNDLAIIYSRMLPAARDITPYLLTDLAYSKIEPGGELLFLSREGDEVLVERQQGFRKFSTPCRMITNNGTLFSMERAVVVGGTTCVGRSGSLVLMPNLQRANECILGIQAWQLKPSYGDEISIQVVTKELLESLTDQCKAFDQMFSKFDIDDEEFIEGETALFTNNNILIKHDEPPVGLIGKTQFKTSPIAQVMIRDGFCSDRVPAALQPFDDRLFHKGAIHPLAHSVNKYFRGQIKPFDLGLLSQIHNDVTFWLRSTLDRTDFPPLRFNEIITGTREDGSNPMNLKSSPGIPYVYEKSEMKGKKRFFEISEEGDLILHDQTLPDQLMEFEESLSLGEIPYSVAYDFPKDELRPIPKALGTETSPPKTRSVTCMNMLYILAWRKYTLEFWSSMHRAADGSFPICPGINPDGPDWSRAWFYLARHPHAVDFDVSNWDGFMPADLFYTAFEIMTTIMSYYPGDSEYAIIHAIGFEVMNSYIKYGKIIYQKHRGLVSGFPGTAEINSLVHFMLLYYIYLQLAPPFYRNFNSFQNLVSKLIYGDDIIITIADEIIDWFNGLTIANQYRAIGYPVTSASKDEEILATKPLNQCQFLKSTWFSLLPTIKLRKMDLSVAYDLLFWERAKTDPIDQFYSNCYDACRIAMGHGEFTCNQFILRLNSWLKKSKLEIVDLNYALLIQDHMYRYYYE
ncbi:MAG: RNA helicase [Guiyang argiope bruennichi polycipivirus 1]|nr:MAG: RNA helicase [Guiyang argiope bruennichi polycipivirus 1]